MGMLGLLGGQSGQSGPTDKGRPRNHAEASVLLVVGVHREERAFGEAVAERLSRERFGLLRIEQGLSGRRPGPDGVEAYRRCHRDLYAQILDHIRPSHAVAIDLHTGFDEAGTSADVLCADPGLLRCVARDGAEAGLLAGKLQGVQLVADQPELDGAEASSEAGASGRWPRLRPEIPRAVWRAGPHLYVGIEVYLPTSGDAMDSAVAFGAAVVEVAAECGLRRVGVATHRKLLPPECSRLAR